MKIFAFAAAVFAAVFFWPATVHGAPRIFLYKGEPARKLTPLPEGVTLALEQEHRRFSVWHPIAGAPWRMRVVEAADQAVADKLWELGFHRVERFRFELFVGRRQTTKRGPWYRNWMVLCSGEVDAMLAYLPQFATAPFAHAKALAPRAFDESFAKAPYEQERSFRGHVGYRLYGAMDQEMIYETFYASEHFDTEPGAEGAFFPAAPATACVAAVAGVW